MTSIYRVINWDTKVDEISHQLTFIVSIQIIT